MTYLIHNSSEQGVTAFGIVRYGILKEIVLTPEEETLEELSEETEDSEVSERVEAEEDDEGDEPLEELAELKVDWLDLEEGVMLDCDDWLLLEELLDVLK